MLEFAVQCETVPGEVVAICGSEPLAWDATQAQALDPKDYPTWRGRITAKQSDVEYKYLIVKQGGRGFSQSPGSVFGDAERAERILLCECVTSLAV